MAIGTLAYEGKRADRTEAVAKTAHPRYPPTTRSKKEVEVMRRLGKHIRQNVVAYIALFFALGSGSAYASHLIVRSSDIVNNEVRTTDVRDDNLSGGGLASQDVRPNALTGSDVSALTGADVNDNSLTGADVDESSLSGVVKNTVIRLGTPVETSVGVVLKADCAPGEVATGGGASSTAGQPRISNSMPVVSSASSVGEPVDGATPDAWRVSVRNEGSTNITVTPIATCAKR